MGMHSIDWRIHNSHETECHNEVEFFDEWKAEHFWDTSGTQRRVLDTNKGLHICTGNASRTSADSSVSNEETWVA